MVTENELTSFPMGLLFSMMSSCEHDGVKKKPKTPKVNI